MVSEGLLRLHQLFYDADDDDNNNEDEVAMVLIQVSEEWSVKRHDWKWVNSNIVLVFFIEVQLFKAFG